LLKAKKDSRMLLKSPFIQCSHTLSHKPTNHPFQPHPFARLPIPPSQRARPPRACPQCASCPLPPKLRRPRTPRLPTLPLSRFLATKTTKTLMRRMAQTQVRCPHSRTRLESLLSLQQPGSRGRTGSHTLVSYIIQARHKQRIQRAS
jgi:hypothetical protein